MARDRRKTTRRDGGGCGGGDQRRVVNLVSLLVTCAMLFVGAKIAEGSFTSDMNRISQNLDSALYNVLEDLQTPNFTDFNINATFNASSEFNPRGMSGLYNVTIWFMDAIIERNIDPDGLLRVDNGQIQLGSIEDQWQSLLQRFSGLLAIVIVLLILAIFFPLCGLCFCCCRCCGRCGARSEPFDKKHDCCRKFLLGTLLICMGTLLLFGVVCAFVSNQHMQDGTEELVPSVRVGVKDAQKYLNVTGQELNILLVVNYKEFQGVLFDVLDRSSQIVYEQLTQYSNAVALTEVSNIVNGLENVKTNLTEMKNITNVLRVSASQLNDALRKVKKDLLGTLNTCKSIPECQELSNKYINNLNTNIDFNNLPDISSEMIQLQTILNDGIVGTVQEGQQKLEGIHHEINETVQINLGRVRDAVRDAGTQISTSVTNITNVLNDVSKFISDNTDQPLIDAQYFIREYSPIRYYVGIGISCVLLLITLCITLGLICGICGKRPDSYSDDCCNKGAGSRFLMIAVALMFLSGIIIAVITIVYFALGLLSTRLVCDSLREYNSSKVLDFVGEVIDLKEITGVDLTIKHVLHNCHRNKSAYTVFNLESQFNLSSVRNYLEEYNIHDALNDLQDRIDANVQDITILTDEAKEQLNKLALSGIANIQFDKFTSVLDDNLTTVDLNDLIKQIDVVIDAVSQRPEMAEIQTKLRLSKLHLETYQERLIEPIISNAKKLIDIASNMEHSLKFGKESFKAAILQLIAEVVAAENYLRENGTVLLRNIAANFTLGVENQVKGYLNRVVDNIEDNVGRCGPLSNVIKATLTSTCDKILLPMNGFWFVLFWSLIVFIMTIILSVKLATLYQKYDSYPGSVIEAEYLYDAYADRENIPLASAKPGKKKKKTKRYDGRNGGYPPESGDHIGAREYPGGSNHQDARYADMAPKHWEDFPNGGPPQYQRAPTEYERPPPYYYPGNGEQN